MAKDSPKFQFLEAKDTILENLEVLRTSLIFCVDEGMIDREDVLYNELLGLIDDVSVGKNWDEMEELIAKAKILEQDIAAWLSLHGKTSVSLPWPKRTGNK